MSNGERKKERKLTAVKKELYGEEGEEKKAFELDWKRFSIYFCGHGWIDRGQG